MDRNITTLRDKIEANEKNRGEIAAALKVLSLKNVAAEEEGLRLRTRYRTAVHTAFNRECPEASRAIWACEKAQHAYALNKKLRDSETNDGHAVCGGETPFDFQVILTGLANTVFCEAMLAAIENAVRLLNEKMVEKVSRRLTYDLVRSLTSLRDTVKQARSGNFAQSGQRAWAVSERLGKRLDAVVDEAIKAGEIIGYAVVVRRGPKVVWTEPRRIGDRIAC
jgi:hypothetical protein